MRKHSSSEVCLHWKCGLILLLVACHLSEAFQSKCQRDPQNTPVSKTPGDGGFQINISGNHKTYIPGDRYSVSLQGKRAEYTVQKFTGFMLIVESMYPAGHYGPQSVGTFELHGDVLTMHSEECPNAVIQTSNILKNDIQVFWNAPPSGSGCLRFKATVIEQRDIWYMDDGELTRDLCEEVQETDDTQPKIINCIACDEAKYEVTFEGLWSRQTHPKDFPANEWLTHFSDIIGASHSNEARVWEYGGLASDGLRQVAEWGSTRTLESELKRQSDHIRTIIKARGLWYPTVNGKTFAVFRVDNRHHLMSLVSMLGPSPDWIVGVSALELCEENGTWVDQKTINLYPYDAGTDSGVAYMSANSPTIPRQRIRKITSTDPNDPKSPFYDPKGFPMKPLAKLTITRQRVYEKSCSDTGILDHDNNHETSEISDPDSDIPECESTEWGKFSPCSVSCGKGLRVRTRKYLNEMKADMHRCKRQMEEKEMCAAQIPYCEGGSLHDVFGPNQYKFDHDPNCMTSEWSTWSPCSVTCGHGFRIRSRSYLDRKGRKKCREELTDKENCVADLLECEQREEEIDPACLSTQWTNWSPCSVTCGKGVRVRTRYFLVPSASEAACGFKTMDKLPCEERSDCSIDESEAKEVCLLGNEIGPCRGYFPRWYYDTERRMCIQFIYGGCRGNRNNFKKFDECTKMCEYARDELHSESKVNTHYNYNTDTRSNPQGASSYGDSNGYDEGSENVDRFGGLASENQLGPSVDCEVSEWSEWSNCSASCGRGWKEMTRTIKVEPVNGGKSCPKKLVKRYKCKLPRCSK